jgi:hypothetical protein
MLLPFALVGLQQTTNSQRQQPKTSGYENDNLAPHLLSIVYWF